MRTLYLNKSERVIESGDGYQTERRHADGCDDSWKIIACHSTLRDALSAYAWRQIRSLPNDDLGAFVSAAEGIMAAVTQIYAGTLEFGQGTFQRQPGR